MRKSESKNDKPTGTVAAKKLPVPKDKTTKARTAIERLMKLDDFNTDGYQNDYLILREGNSYEQGENMRLSMTEAYVEAGFMTVYNKLLEMITKDYNLKGNQFSYEASVSLQLCALNGSDISNKFCKDFLDSKTYITLFQVMNSIPADRTEMLIGVIHNCLRHCDNAKPLFREQGALELMKNFRAKGTKISLVAEIILAYIINDDESAMIDAGGKNLSLVIKILDSALKSPDHTSLQYCFNAEESLEALNKLAVNDSNKEKIVKFGALPHYVKMMKDDCNSREQLQAVQGLWTLAFNKNNREVMKKNAPLMEGLRRLSKNSKDDAIKKGADGALWILEERNESKSMESQSARGRRERTPHIMISYNWGSKPTMLRVRDRLKAAGYKIWMDVDNMSGSTLDAMAKAVEDACVVLVCFSMKYKESPNCRTEAEYTYKLHKDFIPLRLQYKYDADGWLGIFLGTTLWYDLSVEEKFEASVAGLIKSLGDRGKIGAVQSQASKPIIPVHEGGANHVPPPIKTPAPLPRISQQSVVNSPAATWKKKEIEEWLKKNELKSYSNKFSTFNGMKLLALKKMYMHAPEFFYQSLKNELGLQFEDILNFTNALDTL